jgi:hypothetical protein
MTATVNISGTWSEKQKEANGFDTHADLIHKNRILRVPFVGFAEFHQWKENVVGETLTIRITAIEPAIDADGSDPHGVGAVVLETLDKLREMRGKGSVDDIPSGAELAGQQGFDFDGLPDGDEPDEPTETRIGPNGPREVPPPSGEEIAAERDEAKAAGRKAKPSTKPFEAPTGGDAA